MMEHTPGPWEKVAMPRGIAIVSGPLDRRIVDATIHVYLDPARAEADARLIAAAPELLAVLKEVLDWATDDSGFDVFAEDLVPRMEELIDKAEGR